MKPASCAITEVAAPDRSRPREAMTAWTRGLVSLLGLEKLRYRLVEADRLIFKRHVSAVRKYHQRRAGDLLVHLLPQRWVALIMIAHDNQRRNLDVGQLIDVFD